MSGRFVLMGVAGCGKSSVGEALALRGLLTYVDGDDLHPPANIAKMSAGTPLTDADRIPWLDAVGKSLAEHQPPVAIGCSALKRKYRDRIRRFNPDGVTFLHLHAPRAVIAQRMGAREGHFMPTSLLESQFAALEMLTADEAGQIIDIDRPLGEVVDAAAEVITDPSAVWR